ncbi:large ribosomal subunit protein eL39-like [Myotis yumanensis]|uniref:large ribosomal subunit protein eL39-like n=1 Tax=Myotis yumanensis TaxID=159337 RepID=UPI0038D0CA83
MKEKEESPEKELNDMEASNLSDKEFKVRVIRMLKDLSALVHFSFTISSQKTFRIKRFLAKKQKQNRPIPQWIWMKTGNKTRYNSKRRFWRRTKLGL